MLKAEGIDLPYYMGHIFNKSADASATERPSKQPFSKLRIMNYIVITSSPRSKSTQKIMCSQLL